MLPLVSIPFLPEAVGNTLLLVGSFALLLIGAEIFTNGVEWLGHRLGVSESATGSLLAAVGTALPETMIPVIAILNVYLGTGSQAAADEVGVGAILGAPFMLATIAMFLVGSAVIYFSDRRRNGRSFRFNHESTRRDIGFFMIGYTLAFLAALIPSELTVGGFPVGPASMYAIGAALVLLYFYYVSISLRSGELIEGGELDALHLGELAERGTSPFPSLGLSGRNLSGDPPGVLVAVQTLFALGVIIGGAHLFVAEVSWAAQVIGIPTAVLALLIAPLATELPEKFNSILWIARDKDTLAIGNITGAMAFQGTLPVTLGIVFTSWNLTLQWGTGGFLNALSAVLALISAGIVYLRARSVGEGAMNPRPFLIGGLFYAAFLAVVLYHVLVLDLSGAAGH